MVLQHGEQYTRNLEDICREFHNQYKYNIEVDVTRRDLETTKQDPKESFPTFITKIEVQICLDYEYAK